MRDLEKSVREIQREMLDDKVLGGSLECVIAAEELRVEIIIHDIRPVTPLGHKETRLGSPTADKQLHLVFTGGHYDVVVRSSGSDVRCLLDRSSEAGCTSLIELLLVNVRFKLVVDAEDSLKSSALRQRGSALPVPSAVQKAALSALLKPNQGVEALRRSLRVSSSPVSDFQGGVLVWWVMWLGTRSRSTYGAARKTKPNSLRNCEMPGFTSMELHLGKLWLTAKEWSARIARHRSYSGPL